MRKFNFVPVDDFILSNVAANFDHQVAETYDYIIFSDGVDHIILRKRDMHYLLVSGRDADIILPVDKLNNVPPKSGYCSLDDHIENMTRDDDSEW